MAANHIKMITLITDLSSARGLIASSKAIPSDHLLLSGSFNFLSFIFLFLISELYLPIERDDKSARENARENVRFVQPRSGALDWGRC